MKALARLMVATSFVAALLASSLSAATRHVSLDSPNPTPPYATWETAARVIQDAVDAAQAGDTVLVTNGVYAVGSRGTGQVPEWNLSRVVVTNSIRLESVNGPSVTTIDGSGEVRCVYLGTNVVLSGFTLTNGFRSGGSRGGGGVFSESGGTVTNCVLRGNTTSANLNWISSTGGWGGGALNCTLYNCSLTGNSATWGGGASGCTLFDCTVTDNYAIQASMPEIYTGTSGGGVLNSVLYNCTLTGNSVEGFGVRGGGAYGSILYNCTVTGNAGGGADATLLYNCTVTGNAGGGVNNCYACQGSTVFNSIVYYNSGGNYAEGTVLNYCCTTPLPTNGVGNITGPPLFMDMAAGDFRLREDSPCIDAGTNLVGFTGPVTNAWGEVSVVTYTNDATDILGNSRFIDGNGDGKVAWDIGAYEFNSFRPPRFSIAPQLTPDGWTLNITGAPNKWVRLQKSSDLKNWEDVWSGWMGAEGIQQVSDWWSLSQGQPVMFYRVVVQ
jgi:hypothetical protein